VQPLDPGQQDELERRLAAPPADRGHRVAYGVMYATEGVVFGGVLAAVTGGVFLAGSAIGVAVVALLGLVLRAVPRPLRTSWAVRLMVPRSRR
jgi:hypothetical protein